MGNIPQIRNYAPNMIQKRKESASLVKGGTVHRMSPYRAYFINDLLSSSNIYFFLSNPPA